MTRKISALINNCHNYFLQERERIRDYQHTRLINSIDKVNVYRSGVYQKEQIIFTMYSFDAEMKVTRNMN